MVNDKQKAEPLRNLYKNEVPKVRLKTLLSLCEPEKISSTMGIVVLACIALYYVMHGNKAGGLTVKEV